MKKIAIIACAMALPSEKGYTRFSFLADFLVNHGYQVDVFTSSFNHWEKKQRDVKRINKISEKTSYGIFLAKEPGYKKNIDFRRIVSHSALAINMIKVLDKQNNEKSYDLLYCVIPDNFLAASVSKYGKKHNIPVIIDIEDTWPEGMRMIFNIPVISKVVFSPFWLAANIAYKNASAFVGTSDEYRDIPLKYNVNPKLKRKTVYVGSILDDFDQGVKKYKNGINKQENEFWVIYAGTLGSSYDIRTLVKSAQTIYKKGFKNIKYLILGDGPLREQFENVSKEKECNVIFMGYMPYDKMAAYLAISDITINSFVKSAPQSIVNKIGDYLAAGHPMINTCSSEEFRDKVAKDNFGLNVVAEDSEILTDAILELYHSPQKCKEMGERARKIAETQFDRKNSYYEIINIIEDTIQKYNYKGN